MGNHFKNSKYYVVLGIHDSLFITINYEWSNKVAFLSFVGVLQTC